jgi:uncharacterized protein YycO
MVKVIFCTSQKFGAIAIRALTWSDWSHAAIIDGEDVIEATWPRVCVSPLAEVIARHSSCVIVEFADVDATAIVQAARSQIGKPYDLAGILGIALHRDWQEQSKWFCSELVAWAFGQAGVPLFRADAQSRVVPQHLWMLSNPFKIVK